MNIANNQKVGVSRNVVNGLFHNIMGQHTKECDCSPLHALQSYDTGQICMQCMLVVTCNAFLHKVLMHNKLTFHSIQHELEDALISCNGQVENLEKKIEEQRRSYQYPSVKFFLHLFLIHSLVLPFQLKVYWNQNFIRIIYISETPYKILCKLSIQVAYGDPRFRDCKLIWIARLRGYFFSKFENLQNESLKSALTTVEIDLTCLNFAPGPLEVQHLTAW